MLPEPATSHVTVNFRPYLGASISYMCVCVTYYRCIIMYLHSTRYSKICIRYIFTRDTEYGLCIYTLQSVYLHTKCVFTHYNISTGSNHMHVKIYICTLDPSPAGVNTDLLDCQ